MDAHGSRLGQIKKVVHRTRVRARVRTISLRSEFMGEVPASLRDLRPPPLRHTLGRGSRIATTTTTTDDTRRHDITNCMRTQLRCRVFGTDDDTTISTPPRVPLWDHQEDAVRFMLDRENRDFFGARGGMLCDEMGLGKTRVILELIRRDICARMCTSPGRSTRFGHPSLIVVPSMLINNICAQVAAMYHPHTLRMVIVTNKRDIHISSSEIYHYVDIVVTTYPTIVHLYKNRQRDKTKTHPCSALYDVQWQRVLADEAHLFVNMPTQSFKAMCQLRARARWFITGTPVQNYYVDITAAFHFLGVHPDAIPVPPIAAVRRESTPQTPVERGGADESTFCLGLLYDHPVSEQATASLSIYLSPDWIEFGRSVSALLNILMLRRHRRSVYPRPAVSPRVTDASQLLLTRDGDQFRETVIWCDFDSVAEAQLYRHYEALHFAGNGTGDGAPPPPGPSHTFFVMQNICNSTQAMKKLHLPAHIHPPPTRSDLTRQRQQCRYLIAAEGGGDGDHPRVQLPDVSTKIRAALAWLKRVPVGDKILVFSQSVRNLIELCYHFSDASQREYRLVHGVDSSRDSASGTHRRALEDFMTNPTVTVLFLSLKLGNVGLNLHCANHVLFLNLWWNPQTLRQGVFRVDRPGQTKIVHVAFIVIRDTVDEYQYHMCRYKLGVEKAILEGIPPRELRPPILDDYCLGDYGGRARMDLSPPG